MKKKNKEQPIEVCWWKLIIILVGLVLGFILAIKIVS